MSLKHLLRHVRTCTICESALPLGALPILQSATSAKLLIIGHEADRLVFVVFPIAVLRLHDRKEVHSRISCGRRYAPATLRSRKLLISGKTSSALSSSTK